MEILRYTAFSFGAGGGNPAGVVLDASGLDEAAMQGIASEVGYSETAFVESRDDNEFDIRYFSPQSEVPFCGHATIATAVAYADRHGVGPLRLRTKAGPVAVSTARAADGTVNATLVSVSPRVEAIPDEDRRALLETLGWAEGDLDPHLPVRAAYAGAWHPILAAKTRGRLADLDYDMDSLAALMHLRDWATIALIWRRNTAVFDARNPFPPGGVVEDPATGAAAAALGGYLRELALLALPATVEVFQGEDMGRPSRIVVDIPEDRGSGIAVSGTASAIDV